MSYFTKHARALINGGYSVVPIVPSRKYPGYEADGIEVKLSQWQKRCSEVMSPEEVGSVGRFNAGVGLACGKYVIGIDLDIVDADLSERFEKAVLEITGVTSAPTRTGRPPKRLMMFKPVGFVRARSVKFRDTQGREHGIDILGHGRQFISYGIHPDTGLEYTWRDGSPLHIDQRNLPVITPDMAERIMALPPAIIGGVPQIVTNDSPAPAAAPGRALSTSVASVERSRTGAIQSEALTWIVEHLPNSELVSYDEWLTTGYAIFEASKPDAALGEALFEGWSARSPKHEPNMTALKWSQIMRDSRGTVGIGTLIKALGAHGVTLPASIQVDGTSDEDQRALDEIGLTVLDGGVQAAIAEELGGQYALTAQEYRTYLFHVYVGTATVAERQGLLKSRTGLDYVDGAYVSAEERRVVTNKVIMQAQFKDKYLSGSPEDVLLSVAPTAEVFDSRMDMQRSVAARLTQEAGEHVITHKHLSIDACPIVKPSMLATLNAMSVPAGLIGEFTTWCMQSAPSKVYEFAVAGGLSLTGLLAGCHFKSPSDLRPNLYILGAAPSGAGKNHVINCMSSALRGAQADTRHILASTMFSSSGLRAAFGASAGAPDFEDDPNDPKKPGRPDGRSMSKLFVHDEFGKFWSSNSSANKSQHSTGLMADFMTFYTASNGKLPGVQRATGVSNDLPYPHLNILGMSTPLSLYEHMTVSQMREGHINRFLLFDAEAPPAPPSRETFELFSGVRARKSSPAAIRVHELARALVEHAQAREQAVPNFRWSPDLAQKVDIEDDAAWELTHIREFELIVLAHCRRHKSIPEEAFSRLSEQTARIAMVLAISEWVATWHRDPRGHMAFAGLPRIRKTHVEWAFAVVKASASMFAFIAAGGELAADARRANVTGAVMERLKRAGKNGVSLTDLTKSVNSILTGREVLKPYLDAMVERGTVVFWTRRKKGPGKPPTTYYERRAFLQAVEAGEIEPGVNDVGSWGTSAQELHEWALGA